MAMENDDRQTGNSPNNNNNKEHDRFLPIANVGRIMKKVIPGNGKISKEAKETVQECVSEFISFVTGEASDKCQREKRKTINGDDILWAITTLGFEGFVNPLKMYLNRYRELEGEKLLVNVVPKQGMPPSAAAAATNIYSSSPASLLSGYHNLPSYMSPSDHHHLLQQQFPDLPFSPHNSVHSQLTQHQQIDSMGLW